MTRPVAPAAGDGGVTDRRAECQDTPPESTDRSARGRRRRRDHPACDGLDSAPESTDRSACGRRRRRDHPACDGLDSAPESTNKDACLRGFVGSGHVAVAVGRSVVVVAAGPVSGLWCAGRAGVREFRGVDAGCGAGPTGAGGHMVGGRVRVRGRRSGARCARQVPQRTGSGSLAGRAARGAVRVHRSRSMSSRGSRRAHTGALRAEWIMVPCSRVWSRPSSASGRSGCWYATTVRRRPVVPRPSVGPARSCTGAASIAGRAVLVIDDVVTTGATLAAAARALRGRGASHVLAATVARTPRPAERSRDAAYTPKTKSGRSRG